MIRRLVRQLLLFAAVLCAAPFARADVAAERAAMAEIAREFDLLIEVVRERAARSDGMVDGMQLRYDHLEAELESLVGDVRHLIRELERAPQRTWVIDSRSGRAARADAP